MEDFFDWNEKREIPKLAPREWMSRFVFRRVSEDMLEEVERHILETKKAALDFETTGLNLNTYTTKFFEGRTHDSIVGFCLSPDGKTGYYIPVRHTKGSHLNVSITAVVEMILRLIQAGVRFYFHNGFFDQELAQYNGVAPMGEWDEPDLWEDSMILSYLKDTKEFGEHFGSLKALSRKYLDIDQPELEELFPKGYKGDFNFSTRDPSWESVIIYGCMDAICTFLLCEIFKPIVEAPNGLPRYGQSIAYKIEKMCAPSTRWMQRMGVPVDREKVKELIIIGQQEYLDALQNVYTFCSGVVNRDIEPEWFKIFKRKVDVKNLEKDIFVQIQEAQNIEKRTKYNIKGTVEVNGKTYPEKYDLLSNQKLGILFEEMNIPDLRRTENSGQVQVSADEIERLNGLYGSQYPFLPKVSRLAELRKALGTYLFSLYNHVGPDGRLHCRFMQLGTDTGRYTVPKGNPETGGATFPLHSTPAYGDKNRPACLSRIREVFKARPGKVIVAIDFSSVELRIVTNLSKEPLWLNEYFRCSSCSAEFPRDQEPPPLCPECGSDKVGDLHSLTAISFYGREKMGNEKEWKILRGYAKAANFALAYGGGPNALVRATGCSEDEASHHHRIFNQTYSVLKTWWDQVIDFGTRHGFVSSALGRHYPLPDLKLPTSPKEEPNEEKRRLNKIFHSKARRNAVNAPIQMSSADFTKLSQGLIYKECKKRGWLDKVTMIITIHDELVFEVDLDILGEFTQVMPKLMVDNKTVRALKWVVPLLTDCEIGWDWTVPWNIADWENGRVREDGIVVDEKGNPTEKVWPMEMVKTLAPVFGVVKIEEPPELIEVHLKSLTKSTLSLLSTALQTNISEKGSTANIFAPNGDRLLTYESKVNHRSLLYDLRKAKVIE